MHVIKPQMKESEMWFTSDISLGGNERRPGEGGRVFLALLVLHTRQIAFN